MKIVVIGNKGRWAKGHIKTLKNLGVYGGGCDLDEAYQIFIMESNPDGVVIATNAITHYNIVEFCFSNNIPVYCEKPIATEEWQLDKYREVLTRSILEATKPKDERRIIFQAGFQLLYDPTIEAYKESHNVDKFISRRLGGNYRNESSVQTLMIHDIAIAHYLFGNDYTVEEVWGDRAETNGNLLFDNGGFHNVILHSRYARPSFRQIDFLIDGSWNTLEFDNHARPDLLTLALKDFMTSIRYKDIKRHDTPRNNLEFAIGVQQNVFDIEKKIGIR